MFKIYAFLWLLFSSSSFTEYGSLNPDELYCIARAVYSESRGENSIGQAAVAWGVRHRVESPDFPTSPCGVIYEVNTRGVVQFPGIKSVKIDYDSIFWDSAVEIAVLVWIGYIDDPIDGNRFWFAPDKSTGPNRGRMKNLIELGNHLFYDYRDRDEVG